MSENINKYAEIACEYRTMLFLAQNLENNGATLRTPVSTFKSIYEEYVRGLQPNFGPSDYKKFVAAMTLRRPLCELAAESMCSSIMSEDNEGDTSFDIVPMNKDGLKEGVGQKSDINIDTYHSDNLVDTREISLKLYKGKNKKGSMLTQVASGTYLSTLCGLGFDVTGRGKFATPDGSEFQSKKSNMSVIKRHFANSYGDNTENFLDQILEITNKTHGLRNHQTKPVNIDAIRKGIGKSAISPFVSLLTEVNSGGSLKQRVLDRTGLKMSSSKEMVAVCFDSKGKPQVFNSIGNDKFHSRVAKLNSDESTLKIAKSGQGVGFSFVDSNDETLLFFSMPLTININGAWANKDRYDKLDKCHYKKGQLRVTKSKQLDTSTNVWVDIGQIF